MSAVAGHGNDKVEAVSGKRGEKNLEVASRGRRLAQASARDVQGVCAGVADRTVGVYRAGPAGRGGDASGQVTKERVADLLDSLIVDHTLAGKHGKPPGECLVAGAAADNGVDEHANLDADVSGRIGDGRREAGLGEKPGV